jgi:hypothetical protein
MGPAPRLSPHDFPRAAVTPCPPSTYAPRFFTDPPCILDRAGYNRGMKNETKHTIECLILGSLFPIAMVTVFILDRIFG